MGKRAFVLYTIAWRYGSNSECSATCGGGSMERTRTCVVGSDLVVGPEECGGGGSTVTVQCNTHMCAGMWRMRKIVGFFYFFFLRKLSQIAAFRAYTIIAHKVVLSLTVFKLYGRKSQTRNFLSALRMECMVQRPLPVHLRPRQPSLDQDLSGPQEQQRHCGRIQL